MDKLGHKSAGTYVEQVFGNVHKIHIAGILMIMECRRFKVNSTDLCNIIC